MKPKKHFAKGSSRVSSLTFTAGDVTIKIERGRKKPLFVRFFRRGRRFYPGEKDKLSTREMRGIKTVSRKIVTV